MKRTNDGHEQSNPFGSEKTSLLPLSITRHFLGSERVVGIVSVAPSGTPVFVSANLVAVGNANPHLLPPGFESSSVRCEDGILVAACSSGVFVLTGFNYLVKYIICVPFVPENLSLQMNDGIPFVCCSKNDTILYFSAATDTPTNVVTHTIPGQTVTSVVQSYEKTCNDAVFSNGIRLRMAAGSISTVHAIEPNSTLVGFHLSKNLDFVQRKNLNLIVRRNNMPLAVIPMMDRCRALIWGPYSVYFLACGTDPCPELLAFEYVSLCRLDSLYPERTAQSYEVRDHECICSAGKYLLYRGGIYHVVNAL